VRVVSAAGVNAVKAAAAASTHLVHIPAREIVQLLIP
jgi:hypothetical protein